MSFLNKFKKAISPKKGNELSRTDSSRSNDFLYPQANVTSITTQPFASNNPFADPSDVPPPPPYSINANSKSAGLPQSSRQPSYAASSTSASRSSTLATAQADDNDKFAFLSQFDTVFLIDDSSSMSGPRWRETKGALESIVDICTKYDEDGIDIYFINKRESFENVTSSSIVREIFSTTEPRGVTMLATKMHSILDPYVARCERGEKPKPVNLIIITDGKADDPVDDAVEDVAKRLDTIRAVPWQVGIQFFQVGNDAKATKYLEDLDDELPKNNPGMRDIVDTQPYRAKTGSVINSEGILKTVLGAVNRKQDRKKGEALHH
jgi:hypothetical protein